MLDEDVIIVWVEERLDFFWIVDFSVRNVFAEPAKNCEQRSFAPVNQSSFLRLPQMVFKPKFRRCQRKPWSMFE